jgi:hypothetical protein
MGARNLPSLGRCGMGVGVEDLRGKTNIKMVWEGRVTKVIYTDIGKISTDISLSDERFE